MFIESKGLLVKRKDNVLYQPIYFFTRLKNFSSHLVKRSRLIAIKSFSVNIFTPLNQPSLFTDYLPHVGKRLYTI